LFCGGVFDILEPMRDKSKKLPLDEKTVRKLQKVLAREPEVLVAYLFGSRALGFAAKKSDLDIGLVVKDAEKADYRKFYSQVAGQVRGKEVDVRLVAMDDFNPLFAFNVIRPNLCLYQKSEDDRIEVEKEIIKTYFDTQHMRDIYHYYLNKSFKEGTFGHAVKFNS